MTSTGVTWETETLTYKGTLDDGKYFIDLLSAAKELTTTPKEFATVTDNTIVIPQKPTKLYITYSYKTPATTDGDAVIEETKEIDLATWTTDEWVAGKHYIYNLTVTAEEIKIAPRSTDWDEVIAEKEI